MSILLMMKFKIPGLMKISAVLFFAGLVAGNARAAEVTLKSGMVIRGEIMEKAADYVRIKTSFGVEIEYYYDEIRSLDETAVYPERKPWEPVPRVRPSAEPPPGPLPAPEQPAIAADSEAEPKLPKAETIAETTIPPVDVFEIVPELRAARELSRQSREIDSGGEIDAEGYYNLGVTAAQIGEYSRAKMNFLKAINYNPGFSDAYYNLGIVCGLSRQYEEAVEYLRRSIELDPGQADAYFSAGDAYAALGRYTLAQQYLLEARERDPDLTDIDYKLGIILAAQEKYDEARQYLRAALEKNPLSLKAHYQMGLVAAALGQDLEAIHSFKKAIQLEPGFADAHYNLGVLYGMMGEFDKSVAAFQDAVAAGTRNPDAYYNLGMAYLGQAKNSVTVGSLGAFERARENFERARELYSTQTDYETIRRIDEILVEIPRPRF
jgi:tetratricopeptide (TPR) repeat protein